MDQSVGKQYEERLGQLLESTPWFMRALRVVRDVHLPSWCIGAGVIRNLVWDYLEHVKQPSPLADVDVAFFDPSDVSTSRDRQVQKTLADLCPEIPWEVTNQAGVHLWFETVFGHTVPPLSSLEEAISTWPETATSVGVTLDANDRLHVYAPVGLADLFTLVVRRNPARVSLATYRDRTLKKRYKDYWPSVTIIHK